MNLREVIVPEVAVLVQLRVLGRHERGGGRRHSVLVVAQDVQASVRGVVRVPSLRGVLVDVRVPARERFWGLAPTWWWWFPVCLSTFDFASPLAEATFVRWLLSANMSSAALHALVHVNYYEKSLLISTNRY